MIRRLSQKDALEMIAIAKAVLDDAVATVSAQYPATKPLLSLINPDIDRELLTRLMTSAIVDPELDEQPEVLLRSAQACRILNRSLPTLHQLEREGKIKAIMVGKERRWRKDDVLALIQ